MGTKAVGYLHGTVVWTSSAVLNNSQTNDVIVDTGPLTAGNYLFGVTGFCDATWTYDVKWMQSDNVAVNQFIRRNPPAGPDDLLFPNKIAMGQNERLKVVCVVGPGGAGNVNLSIFYMEMG